MNEQLQVEVQVKLQEQIDAVMNATEAGRKWQQAFNQGADAVGKVYNAEAQGILGSQTETMKRSLSSEGAYDVFQVEKNRLRDVLSPTYDDLSKIQKDLEIDMAAGSFSKAKAADYVKKIRGLQEQGASAIDDYLAEGRSSSILTDEQLAEQENLIKKTREAFIDDFEQMGGALLDFNKGMEESGKKANDFFEGLRRSGGLAVAGLASDLVVQYAVGQQQIEAKYRTGFDFTSPMGMYSQTRQAEVFDETKNRELIFNTVGSVLGAVAGGALGSLTGVGTGIGAVLGGTFGGRLGTGIASYFNVETESKNIEDLKVKNELLNMFTANVQASSAFDVGRARMRGRGIDENPYETMGLGFTPEQEIAMRMSQQQAFGEYDRDIYRQQTMYARAQGIDPNSLYQFGYSARITGADVGAAGLASADEFARRTIGPDVAPTRIIDILTETKNIQEKLLNLNIEAKAENADVVRAIPGLLFGNENPYGRIDLLGSTTLKNLEDLMRPRSGAQEAFLFQSLGEGNILNFTERMKKGTFGDDNLEKILRGAQNMGGGSEFLTYFMLNEMMPNAPAGFNTKISSIVSGGGLNDLLESISELKEINKSGTDEEKAKAAKEFEEKYKIAADSVTASTERQAEAMAKMQNSLGDSWRDLAQRMQRDWTSEWLKVTSNTETRMKLEKDLNEVLTVSIDKLKEKMNELGYDYTGEFAAEADSKKAFNAEVRAASKVHYDNSPKPEDLRPVTQAQWDSIKVNAELLQVLQKINTALDSPKPISVHLYQDGEPMSNIANSN
jgi:hypothetical protein